MQISTSKIVDEEQFSLPGKTDSGISLRPELRRPEIKEIREKSDPVVAFRAFISTVERLELLLEQETAALGENKLITLDDFNQKKAMGSLSYAARFVPSVISILKILGLTQNPSSQDCVEGCKAILLCFRLISMQLRPSPRS